MKQRLLLALLMLLTSAGFMKADDSQSIRISIPKGEVTIKLTSDNFEFTLNDYPQILLDEKEVVPTTPTSTGKGSTVIWTIKQDKEEPVTYDLQVAAHDWGNISLELDGNVSEFIVQQMVDNAPLQSLIKSLAFKNNTELTTLTLYPGNGWSTLGLPKLESLTFPATKLKWIPAKPIYPEGQKELVYTITSSAETLVALTEGSARSYKLNQTDWESNSFVQKDAIKPGDLTITNLRDIDGKVLTDISAQKDQVDGSWSFIKASGDQKYPSIYMDGNYMVDLKVSADHKTYPGLVMANVKLSLLPVTFTLGILSDTEKGKYHLSLTDQQNVKRGDELVITPLPNDGFVFAGYVDVVGLEKVSSLPTDPKESSRFRVVGNTDPSLKLDFSNGDAKVVYESNNSNGSITVYRGTEYDGADKINSGDVVEVNSDVTIEVKPNEYSSAAVQSVTVNGKDVYDPTKLSSDGSFRYTCKVPADGLKILASFTNGNHKLTLKSISSSDVWEKVEVIGNNGIKYYPKSGSDPVEVADGERLTINIQLKYPKSYNLSSVLLNSKELPVLKTGEGSYLVKDVFMPNTDATLVVGAKALATIPAVVLKSDVLYYTGEAQNISFSTQPSGLSGIKVTYLNSEGLECSPINVGKYTAQLYRPADDLYREFEQNVQFEIKPASLYITKLPTIIKKENGDFEIGNDGKVQYAVGNGFSTELVEGTFGFNDAKDGKCGTLTFSPDASDNYSTKQLTAVVFYGDAADKIIPVEIISSENVGNATLLVKNRDAVVDASVVEGTILTFGVLNQDPVSGSKLNYTAQLVNEAGEILVRDLITSSGINMPNLDKYIVKFDVKDDREELMLSSPVSKKEVVYNENVQTFPLNLVYNSLNKKPNNTIDGDKNHWTIKYFLEDGTQITSPVNVGNYTVKVSRVATQSYLAFETECEFEIKAADIPVERIPRPIATAVTKGSTLVNSSLIGEALIAGEYQFDVSASEMSVPLYEDKNVAVKFCPADHNYNEVKLTEVVKVKVTDRAVLTFGYSPNGWISVKDAANTYYYSGDPVISGTKLTVIPTPNEDCYLVSVKVNGTSLSSPYTFEFKDEPVYIEAVFEKKKEEIVDPNSRYTVNVTKVLRGAVIDKPGANSVKRGESFSFSVATLAADASKVVVKVDGVTIKPVSGKYTITNITENKEVSVTLANPTPIKVTVPTEYKNKGGYLMGRVKISGPSDGKYYYNDQITLVAFPESGVHFDGWTGDLTGLTQIKEVVLTKDLTAGAKFSGTPTGIEDIMAASIATGKGCVWVRGIANADVTIVSIAGRVQAQERISGDTRIDVPAGIYVVVLESGSDVKRVKVIVK